MGQENRNQSAGRGVWKQNRNRARNRTILAVAGVVSATICMLGCCMFYTTGSFRLTWKRFLNNVVKSTSLTMVRSESNVMGYLDYSQNSVDAGPIVQAFNMMVPLHTYIVHADDIDFDDYVQMAKAAINENEGEKEHLAQGEYDDFLYYNGKIYDTARNMKVQDVIQDEVVEGSVMAEDSNILSQDGYQEDESTTMDAQALETTANTLALSQLSTYENLIKYCYTVDRTTVANKDLFQAKHFTKKDLSLDIDYSRPQILLYHTHSQEAFYDSRPGQVADTIVGVGDVLAEILEEEYGVRVIHDRSSYDVVNGKLERNDAYTRALPCLEAAVHKNPGIEVMIDLHRDGMPAGLDPKAGKRMAVIDGEECAQIMLFNGLSANANGPNETLPNPNLEDNLAFSFQMFLDGKSRYPGLMKPIYLKPYRFNMHLKPRSTLVELGTQYNTVEEAKNSMKYLAEILMDVLQKKNLGSLK